MFPYLICPTCGTKHKITRGFNPDAKAQKHIVFEELDNGDHKITTTCQGCGLVFENLLSELKRDKK